MGLFGKLPTHGDFVSRGWPDDTVDAIDGWLSAGIGTARATRDEDAFAAWMRSAPMWQGFVPGGTFGAMALYVALAPSIDRAGRLFPLVAGVSGPSTAVWAQLACGSPFPRTLDDVLYDAVAGRLEADGMFDRLVSAIEPVETADDAAGPDVAAWWPGPPDDRERPFLTGQAVDAALLEQLFSEGMA